MTSATDDASYSPRMPLMTHAIIMTRVINLFNLWRTLLMPRVIWWRMSLMTHVMHCHVRVITRRCWTWKRGRAGAMEASWTSSSTSRPLIERNTWTHWWLWSSYRKSTISTSSRRKKNHPTRVRHRKLYRNVVPDNSIMRVMFMLLQCPAGCRIKIDRQ